ncbi:hypothetical protein [Cytobacillus firmus]|uniref:hypothetical protein n=1 Tax=Cytobacillus firmus TaxID=1399 RepID=UPI001C97B48D|nr:hypothetical protein [Cytobacillus firmus]MBY6052782.1 hypothetical protein [Cytobacillus firmus]
MCKSKGEKEESESMFEKLKKVMKHEMEAAKKQAEKNVSTIELDYIGGHPKITKKSVKIRKGVQPNEIVIINGINEMKATLLEYQWGEQGVRSVGKAATGAIIGGVLTGGLGAIAGAAIGAKKKDKSILHLAVEQNGQTYHMQLRADQKKYNEFAKKILG